MKKIKEKKILQNILTLISKKILKRSYSFMEVCGTHTMSIAKFGIRDILPENIKLLSGPGCPVCVTPQEVIDAIIELAKNKNVIITTFGDMMRVPGSKISLEEERIHGAQIRIIYSPEELLGLASSYPEKEIVFIGVGFETTSPSVASVIKKALQNKIKNISVFTAFKIIPPALRAILNHPKIKIEGFILPGHVSTIIGSHAYDFIPEEYGIPGVISGFEPIDILLSISILIEQCNTKKFSIENEYIHGGVTAYGNKTALALLDEVFTIGTDNWRAIGDIKDSGLFFREKYKMFDAKHKFNIKVPDIKHPSKCICGNILLGLALPTECKLFGLKCTPAKPVGPCMVSTEGSCAAYYKYAHK
ncbi:MAG: hydrogenase formation protein HypD [Candidatus Firestonebacteria bacterium]|nr:hydrogenase formation protein HypD [Candidatus Firestonebacteria bacterium]